MWPSGGERTIDVMPTMELAPGRFSTTVLP
jgi:hypothetical protein